eukprot:scaffold375_cov378-Prasinococcus_capsulatus_cf.AAC.5
MNNVSSRPSSPGAGGSAQGHWRALQKSGPMYVSRCTSNLLRVVCLASFELPTLVTSGRYS